MDYRQTLIKMVDRFNVKAVEEFKEIELRIYAESRSVFKKNKDYAGNIEKLKKIKTNAQKIDPKSVKVPDGDKQAKGLMDNFQKCLVIFSGVCDAYIQFETALMNKAEGSEEKVKYSDIKNFKDKMRMGRTNLNKSLDELNIWYAEFNDMEREKEENTDLGDIKYMTYEDLVSSDGDD